MEFDSEKTLLLEDNRQCIVIGSSSVIGSRSEQQDAILADKDYAYIQNKRVIAVLCDGMGGLNGGAAASQIASAVVYQEFLKWRDEGNLPGFFRDVIPKIDREVRLLENEDGTPMRAGTTLVSVIIQEDQLYWASVGDSHIYIIRDGKMLCITEEHNYMKLLREKVMRGEITEEEMYQNPQKEALISYIGMGGVRCVDLNYKPLQLLEDDYIVLCSDGLYRTVEEKEMKEIIYSSKDDVREAAVKLTDCALSKGKRNQDNTSVVVIKYSTIG
ncbi:MAG: serine/threonine-protein phosphatase [Lachnospiraceae bacterium]|nr:serine/threonine-protein phosphatase [Lachnospiraceae bacterium]